MQHQVIVPLAGMVMIVTLALGVPFVRALTRRWERVTEWVSMPFRSQL